MRRPIPTTIAAALLLLAACAPPAGEPVEGGAAPPEPHVEPAEAQIDEEDDQPQASGGPDAPGPARPTLDATAAWLSEAGAVDSGALAAWMKARQYRIWTGAPGISPSAEGGTRVFLNPTLESSLRDGAEDHPIGAVGVRELYEDDLITPRAINLIVKLEADEGDGAGWLWVELVDLSPSGQPSIEEPAAAPCMSCHAATSDLIMSEWPL